MVIAVIAACTSWRFSESGNCHLVASLSEHFQTGDSTSASGKPYVAMVSDKHVRRNSKRWRRMSKSTNLSTKHFDVFVVGAFTYDKSEKRVGGWSWHRAIGSQHEPAGLGSCRGKTSAESICRSRFGIAP